MPVGDYTRFKIKEGKYAGSICYGKYTDWLSKEEIECFIENDNYETAIIKIINKDNLELVEVQL